MPAYRLKAPTGTVTARLASVQVPATGSSRADQAPAANVSPHAQYTLTDDSCAVCHSAHRATGKVLLQAPSPVSTLCFRCHDGTGASADVQSQYTNPALPANDAATSSYYSHPATDAVQPHHDELESSRACPTGTPSAPTATSRTSRDARQRDADRSTGWTSAGPIKGASGVAVANGAANTVPAFTWQRTNQYEYQLCFKCHSGYTTLPAQDPAPPSRWALDKSVELNPANLVLPPRRGRRHEPDGTR